LFTFLLEEGLEPTDNSAGRICVLEYLWRKRHQAPRQRRPPLGGTYTLAPSHLPVTGEINVWCPRRCADELFRGYAAGFGVDQTSRL